jgi:uncharacterized protein (DUF1778 family)
MATRPTSRQSRLDFRVKPEHKTLIERAASVRGQSLTDFAVSALLKEAGEVIEQAELRTLSRRDSTIFLQMLNSEAMPNAALKRAAKRYKNNRG